MVDESSIHKTKREFSANDVKSSDLWKWYVQQVVICLVYGTESESHLIVPWLFATPWTIQCIEFSRQEYWSGRLFPSPGNLPTPGIEPRSPTLQADSLPAELPGKLRISEWYRTVQRRYYCSKRLYMNTSYNPECKFTLKQITPTTYVSPSHAFSAVTIETQWESHGQRRLTGVHTILKSWIQLSA